MLHKAGRRLHSGPTTTNCQMNGYENGQTTECTCATLFMVLVKVLTFHIKIVDMNAFKVWRNFLFIH